MDHGALAEPTARIDPVTTSENYVNASIPNDQLNDIIVYLVIFFVFVKIAPMQIVVTMYD